MTAELINILSSFGQSATDQIRANVPKATGKTAQSLRFEVIDQGTKATLRILGKPYFMVVETGRKPTPQYTKPSKTFVDSIKEWLAAKGGNQGAAYAIAKTIHKEGTKLWQQGGRKDVVSNVVNQSLTEQISQSVLKDFARQYLVSVVKLFNDNRSI